MSGLLRLRAASGSLRSSCCQPLREHFLGCGQNRAGERLEVCYFLEGFMIRVVVAYAQHHETKLQRSQTHSHHEGVQQQYEQENFHRAAIRPGSSSAQPQSSGAFPFGNCAEGSTKVPHRRCCTKPTLSPVCKCTGGYHKASPSQEQQPPAANNPNPWLAH